MAFSWEIQLHSVVERPFTAVSGYRRHWRRLLWQVLCIVNARFLFIARRCCYLCCGVCPRDLGSFLLSLLAICFTIPRDMTLTSTPCFFFFNYRILLRSWETFQVPAQRLLEMLKMEMPPVPEPIVCDIEATTLSVYWHRPPAGKVIDRFRVQVNGVIGMSELAGNACPLPLGELGK